MEKSTMNTLLSQFHEEMIYFNCYFQTITSCILKTIITFKWNFNLRNNVEKNRLTILKNQHQNHNLTNNLYHIFFF